MWEQIRANKRKSLFLFSGMFFVLAVLGFVVGGAIEPNAGPFAGLAIAAVVALIMGAVSYFAGDNVILLMAGAREVTHDIHPQLFNVVEEMKIAANFPIMPRVYIMPDMTPNAFAVGKRPENSAIVVTAGLLSRLNRDELQGVIAHEMSHILNRDVLFMTMAGVMLGSIVFIAEVFLRSLWFRGGSRYSGGRSRSSGGGQAQVIFMLIAFVMALLAPIAAQLFYFAISRKREYLADASAARLTRYPEGLASALEKISASFLGFAGGNEKTSKVLAPMYIVNPLHEKKMSFSSWSSTHPPTHMRIKVLRSMTGGVSFRDYESAFEKITGERKALIPPSDLGRRETIGLRKASADQAVKEDKKSMRDAGDIIRAMSSFIFLMCACGLKIKLSPDYKKPSIVCPRCGRLNRVPQAELIAAMGTLESGHKAKTAPQQAEHFTYKRKTGGWETFACACGNHVQLSPLFRGRFAGCARCGRQIEIKTDS